MRSTAASTRHWSPMVPADPPQEPNPWLREGADAPDAADIEDPSEQR